MNNRKHVKSRKCANYFESEIPKKFSFLIEDFKM